MPRNRLINTNERSDQTLQRLLTDSIEPQASTVPSGGRQVPCMTRLYDTFALNWRIYMNEPTLVPHNITTHYPVQANVPESWGQWLNEYDWSHYCTLTFQREATIDGASRQFHRFVRRLERRNQRAVTWFMVIERGGGGWLHIHSLLGATNTLPNKSVDLAWTAGITDVQTYDSQRGATHYITKDITSEATFWDISKNLKGAHKQLTPSVKR